MKDGNNLIKIVSIILIISIILPIIITGVF